MASTNEDTSRLAEQVLAAYREDLWLKRRLQVDEAVTRLEALIPQDSSRGDAEEYIRELIKFLRFLESECSGKIFQNDKQWGELMNLMQISRKLNHKSVKFKDILKNRTLIEANARDIKRFNEFVRSCCLIDEFIRAFETNLALSHLTLWPLSSDSNSNNKLQNEAAATKSLNEILRARRHAEITLKTSANNLRVHLRNELVLQKASATQLETWTKKFDQFERVAQKLCHFLESLYNLKRELSLLRPLVESVLSSNAQDAIEHSGRHNKGQQLTSSLASCKQNFKQILEFQQALEVNLRTLVQRTSVATVSRSRLASSVSSNRSSKEDSTKKTSNQQVSPLSDLKLVKLLKPDKSDEFASELYGSRLDQSLGRAVECRRSLDEMMATLRLEFGRFYFVNDLELLRIISLDSRLAQECHQEENKRLICKLFNNSVETFLLSGPDLVIDGVQTPAGERILLAEGQDPVPLKKRVNIYSLEIVRILNELLRKLQRSLRTILADSLRRKGPESGFGIDWSLPIQLLGVAEQIKFTERVELALLKGNDYEKLLKEYEARLKSLGVDEQKVQPSTLTMQLKRSAMVSFTVHFISTLLALKSEPRVKSTNDWRWQRLARYYLLKSKELEVRIANSSFDYKFDLLPVDQDSPADDQATNASIKRLIYTKTSEHCFLVASQALGRLKLGASPYGPAGSGKTETVKALGQLLGCQVIVHNCDETNEAQALERLVWGLAHTGLWGCFDEFNRLSSSCLSSISALLELVQTNLRSGATTLELDDGQIKSIDQASAFFVTMNPGDGAKYRGRRRLPANLRSLFLPVAMVQVQVESIVREMLLSYWSSSASVEVAKLTNAPATDSSLAERMGLEIAQWVEWMRAHLQVARCEWDLRLVMNILKRFKRTTSAAIEKQLGCDAKELEETLVECIAKEVQPRLSQSEFKILDESLQQVFKGLSLCRCSQQDQNKLQQLADQLETRSGVILLGGSQSGKTTLWHSLIAQRNASNDANNKLISWFALNPKSCAKSELFGSFGAYQFDAMGITKKNRSNKWSDGLFTKLVRNSIELLQNKEEVQQVWLVLDGPLDPDWIESLNSVLDDNQVLTLGSGERLNFVMSSNYGQKSIKLIFETDSVSCVSPATISRIGLLHLESLASAQIANAATVEPNKLELTIFHTDSSFSGLSTSLLMDHLKLESGILHTLEYSCFEGSKSRHLIELLDLVRTLEESNPEVKRDANTLLLIHNLHLIEKEDRWQTRTFIEMLRHLVAYGFYYDSEHNLHGIQGARCAVTTSYPNGLGGRFRSLARAVVKVAVASEIQETVLMFDELVQMIVYGSSLDMTHNNRPIALVKVSEHQEVQEVLINLHNALIQKQENPSSAPIELYKFNNSANIQQSLEKLAKFSRSQADSQDTGPGLGPGSGPASKRRVFLLDSLVWPLMTKDQQAELCHLLNLIKLKQVHPASLLILMFAPDNDLGLGGFWRQITLGGSFRLAQTYQVGDTKESLIEYLSDKLDGSSMDLQWLSSWMVEKKRPEFARESYLQFLARMISSLSGHIAYQRRMLTTSLRRLADFEVALEEVKARRGEEEAALDQRQQEIMALLKKINQEIEHAKGRSEQLNDLKRKQHEKTKELEASKRQIERELAEVEPLVKASKREVRDSLKPEALNEIKTLRLPPKTIKDILDVLFVLLQPEGSKPNLDWTHMKSYLARGTLRDELTNFNYQARLASSLSSGNNNSEGVHANSLGPPSQTGGNLLLIRVEREIELRRESFRLEQAARASSAIVPIVRWIQAALEYGRVLNKLGPLTESMRRCESETGELSEALARLERQQQEVDQKIAGERQRLAEFERDYERARMESERVKLDLDRAEEIRSNLGDQVSRWRAKLTYYNEHLTSDEQLCRVCLVCSLLAQVGGDGHSRLDMLERVMDVHSLVSGIAKPSKDLNPIASFALKYLAPLLECVDQEDSSSSMVECELMFSRGSEVASKEQLDHFVKLAIIKLNLNFDQGRLLVLRVAETHPIDQLCKYLSYKGFLCDKGDANLVLVRPMTDDNWRQTAEVILQLGDKMALVEMPLPCSSGADAGHQNLTLDILDFFRNLRVASASSRVILFVRSSQSLLLESCELVRLLDIDDGSSSDGRRQTGEDLERELANNLLELHEPQLSSNLNQLELELKKRQQEARQLESNLSKGLMFNESTSKTSDATLAPQNQLVRLLGDLNQSSKLLFGAIEGIQQKLQDLQSKKTRFAALASRASAFYVEHLADLKLVDYFYHLPPRRFAELLMRSSGKDNDDWKYATIERVMCSLRPEERNKRMFGLDQRSLTSLQQSVSNLKQQFTHLVESMQDNNNNSFRLAIVLHDSKRSSPQMEVDEFMRASADCQYHKLYATTDPQAARASRLEAQLERVMAPNRSSELKCICITNAHLASEWLNSRLLELIKRVREKSQKLLVILVGEQEDGSEDGGALSASLLDEAHLKCWHDELGLPLVERFKLYKQLTSQVGGLGGGGKLADQLILFHVVCQELTKRKQLLNKEHTWQRPQNYAFDREQLALAFKVLEQICSCDLEQRQEVDWREERATICNYLEAIVYGARMETRKDEQLLTQLMDKFLRSCESAHRKLSMFWPGLEDGKHQLEVSDLIAS